MSETSLATLDETSRFLNELYGPGVGGLRRIGAGAWSQAFVFEHGGVEQVIRWSRFSDNFERDAFAARFREEGLPIPEISALGQRGEYFYAVSPFSGGTYLERLPVAELERTLPALLGLLRSLRAVDLSATTGFGIWNKKGSAPHASWRAALLDDKNDSPGSLIQGWRGNLEASPLGMETFNRIWSRFEQLVERCPDERQLVHSDLVNGNTLAADGQITALLDWGSSIFGDALYDVAWLIFCQHWFPQFGEIDLARQLIVDFRADPNANTTDLDARLRCYLLHIGLDSIAYNAFKQDWHTALDAAEYTLGLMDGVDWQFRPADAV